MSIETAAVVLAVMSVFQTALMGVATVNSIHARSEARNSREQMLARMRGAEEVMSKAQAGAALGYTVIPCGTSGGDIAHWHVVGPDGTFVGDEHETESSAREIAAMLNARHGYMQ